MIARSAFAPRESRAPSYQPQSAAPLTSTSGSGVSEAVQPTANSAFIDAHRRPLTEPGTRITQPVGFQTPTASRPITPSRPQETTRPLLEVEHGSSGTRLTTEQPLRVAETDLRELDRRIKKQEAEDEEDAKFAGNSVVPSAMSPTTHATPLSDVKMERLKDDLGGEMIDGTIRVFFEVGQKRAHLHVPFSPPLAGLPEVECEAVGDDSVRCKVAVRQPYGIRIEARRSEASRALNTEIGFAAVYTPSARRG